MNTEHKYRLNMNANEPVAYIDPYDLERLPHYDCHIGSQQLKNGIPLYTHPVKEHFEDEPQAEELHEIMQSNAELTDEEINIVGIKVLGSIWNCYDEELVDFARAILLKAQKKCQ